MAEVAEHPPTAPGAAAPVSDDAAERAAGTGSRRIADVLAVDPGAPAIEFEGSWRTLGRAGGHGRARRRALVERPGAEVGILLRNRPASVGLLLGVLRAGGAS